MPKKVKFVPNKKGIKELLNDPQIIEQVRKDVSGELEAKFEQLYPGSKWESEVGQAKTRKRVIIKTEEESVAWREAETGRIRKALRGKLTNTQKGK